MSTEEPVQYLAILKASYDYTPQSDDEIAIKQGQQLLLVEKVDDEYVLRLVPANSLLMSSSWWKVKVTGNEEEADNQIGLVPAAYVEQVCPIFLQEFYSTLQAPHTSVVKVLYDYEAVAPGELTVHENDILLLFETEEDWLLVQDSRIEGRAGFVPGNYVEVVDEDEAKESTQIPNRIIVPDSVSKTRHLAMTLTNFPSRRDLRTWIPLIWSPRSKSPPMISGRGPYPKSIRKGRRRRGLLGLAMVPYFLLVNQTRRVNGNCTPSYLFNDLYRLLFRNGT